MSGKSTFPSFHHAIAKWVRVRGACEYAPDGGSICCAHGVGVLTLIMSRRRCAGWLNEASIAKWSKAPVCGTGDHGFESRCSPHHPIRSTQSGRRAKPCACSSMDRALGFGPRGCGFESCQARHSKIQPTAKAHRRPFLCRAGGCYLGRASMVILMVVSPPSRSTVNTAVSPGRVCSTT